MFAYQYISQTASLSPLSKQNVRPVLRLPQYAPDPLQAVTESTITRVSCEDICVNI